MRYQALATDYDGTVAWNGTIANATVTALLRLKESGRRLFLVTGREVDDLLDVCPQIHLFDHVVAENGALLYRPETKETTILAEPPAEQFIQELRRRGVRPLSVGRVIVATVEPNYKAVLETIHQLGLELQVIFNKGSVMILPSGLNKATGLHALLAEMGLSRLNVVGIGDAENDHSFLALCGVSIAVANALPSLKEKADLVTAQPCGAGVMEAVDSLLADDFASLIPKPVNHVVPAGLD